MSSLFPTVPIFYFISSQRLPLRPGAALIFLFYPLISPQMWIFLERDGGAEGKEKGELFFRQTAPRSCI